MKILLLFFVFSSFLFSNDGINDKDLKNLLLEYKKYDNEINNQIKNKNVWFKSYETYLSSLQIHDDLKNIRERIKYLEKNIDDKNINELNSLKSKEKILSLETEKIGGESTTPFLKLITPPKIEEIKEISNPIEMINAYFYLSNLEKKFNIYLQKKDELQKIINILEKQYKIYKKIQNIEKNELEVNFDLKRLEDFRTALDTFNLTTEVYKKRLELAKLNINKKIKIQEQRIINIFILILIVFLLSLTLKLVIKKYISNDERFYMANKFLTFISITVISLILLFSYIEETTYLATILGFASAGIAIAMKDWFMSILGWLVIVIGGSIHVGDRIRVDMDGVKYVGDVMDISLLRITIMEDITLTTITSNRRAGRTIFVPNNYIFTRMIANYSHYSLKTVWDGVKITITFDSNHEKALKIAKEIAKKYSKSYTDITRTQYKKLRNQYSLKNTQVEPRVFSFIADNGIVIDTWYLNNAHATLTLRSIISLEIIKAFKKEDDITISYPTQKLFFDRT